MTTTAPTNGPWLPQRINTELLGLLREAAQPMGLSARDFAAWLPRARGAIDRALALPQNLSPPPWPDELPLILRNGPYRAGAPELNVGRGRVTRVPIHDGCNLIVGHAMASQTRVAGELAALWASSPEVIASARDVVGRVGAGLASPALSDPPGGADDGAGVASAVVRLQRALNAAHHPFAAAPSPDVREART